MNYINRHDKKSYSAKYGTGRYILCYTKVTKAGVPRKGARRKIISRYETVNGALNIAYWLITREHHAGSRNYRLAIYDSHWNVIWQDGGRDNGN